MMPLLGERSSAACSAAGALGRHGRHAGKGEARIVLAVTDSPPLTANSISLMSMMVSAGREIAGQADSPIAAGGQHPRSLLAENWTH